MKLVRNSVWIKCWVLALAVLAMSPMVSRGTLYDLTFSDGGAHAGYGQIDVQNGLAVSGSFTLTAGTGLGIWNLITGSGFDGGFAWDNQVTVGSDPFLSQNGLLFSSGTDDRLNLYYYQGNYNLYERVTEQLTGPYAGTAGLTVAVVPEPTGYALALFGLVVIGGMVGRSYIVRSKRPGSL